MYPMTPEATFYSLLSKNEPQAAAVIAGNDDYPALHGYVRFFETPYSGLLLEAEIYGLPQESKAAVVPGQNRLSPADMPHFYGMHIHETGDCTPPFEQTGSHFNPRQLPHPHHIGDLLPLMSSNGYAFSIFYDALLTVADIDNRSLIIHAWPDNFTTQPSGDSGSKIGCGVIRTL